jgi:hypothetical protein
VTLSLLFVAFLRRWRKSAERWVFAKRRFFNWKKKYGDLGVSELRCLRQLDEENRNLKQLVAELGLNKAMLQAVLQKSSEAGPAQSAGGTLAKNLRGELAPRVHGHAATPNGWYCRHNRPVQDASPTKRMREIAEGVFGTAWRAFTYCFDKKTGRQPTSECIACMSRRP